jgi:hypothetical protein
VVQAQRILVTEPENRFQLPSAASVLEPVVGALQSTFRRIPRALAAAKQLEAGEQSRIEIELDREEVEEQLRSFDEQLRRRKGSGRRARWWEE